MPIRFESEDEAGADHNVLLVMVPGMGIQAADFHTRGLIAEVERRRWPVTTVIVDPGADAYLDGSVEDRLLAGIDTARRTAGVSRVWLAGISLGCQGILRCVRARPGAADGLMFLTPYLASTGLIAEIGQAGGLKSWAASEAGRAEPDRLLLRWLATTPAAELPRILMGHALGDRFAATARMLAALLPPDHPVSVDGGHDWDSWAPLWRLMLDRNPFGEQAAAEP